MIASLGELEEECASPLMAIYAVSCIADEAAHINRNDLDLSRKAAKLLSFRLRGHSVSRASARVSKVGCAG